VVVAVVVMSLFSSSLQLLQSTMIAHFSQRLQLGLVLEFGRKILHLPLNYYETRRSGEIVSRLRDINEINNLVAQVVALTQPVVYCSNLLASCCFIAGS